MIIRMQKIKVNGYCVITGKIVLGIAVKTM